MTGPADRPVRQRRVLFIAGFDPKSPRYYHAFYRREARRQAAVSGLHLQVGPLHEGRWAIHADSKGQAATHAVYQLLAWDDIVRAHWAGSAWQVLRAGARTLAYGLRDGAVQRMYRLSRPPVYANFLPFVLLLASALVALLAGAGLGHLARGQGLPTGAALAAGAGLAAGVLAAGWQLVHRLQFTWVLRLVHFTVAHVRGQVPALDQRLDQMAQQVAEQVRQATADQVDEVLLVGHSVGATLAVQALARALVLDPQLAHRGPALRLLSLGHCVPLASMLGAAESLRRDLQTLGAADIDWLDITAPIDWAAFPGVDPVTGQAAAADADHWHPRCLSPRFHLAFAPASYTRLRRNRFRVHMQYLQATERVVAYDYFGITAGALSLRQRFDEPHDARAPGPGGAAAAE